MNASSNQQILGSYLPKSLSLPKFQQCQFEHLSYMRNATKSSIKKATGFIMIIGIIAFLSRRLELREFAKISLVNKHHYALQLIQFDSVNDPRWQAHIERKQECLQLDRYRPSLFNTEILFKI